VIHASRVATALGFLVFANTAVAQDRNAAQASATDPKGRKALTVDDYSKWRSIDAAQISADGKWVAYGVRFTNVVTPDAKPVLHIVNLATNQDVSIADATNAAFSSDSKWVVYQIETPAPRPGARPTGPGAPGAPGAPVDSAADTSSNRARNGTPGQPTRKTELRELATGKVQSWQDIATATFSPTATHLLLRRRPPTPAGGAGGAGGPGGGGPPGGGQFGGGGGSATVRATDALLHTLATSRTQFLGSVGTAEFNRTGSMLAYTVDAPVKDGNGLFIADLRTGSTAILDNDAKTYNRLAWNDDGTAVAVLKGKEVPRMREKDNVLVVFPNVSAPTGVGTPSALDASLTSGFPKGWVVSDRASLAWSDDNKRVFFGIMKQVAAPDTGRKRSTDSVPDVDVWRTQDERVQSLQMIRADEDRNFTYRQAFDVAGGKFIPLADTTMKELEVAPDGRWAVGHDVRGYIVDYGGTRADVYRVNTSTGERTLMFKGLLTGLATAPVAYGISPDGKHYTYWKDNAFQDYDLDAGVSKPLGAAGAPSFVDTEFDYPGGKPPFSGQRGAVEAYSKDGKGVIVRSRYDLWYLPYGSGAAKNITNGEGAKSEMELRYVRTAPSDPMAPRAERERRVIDLARPVTLSAYGFWTKKSGFYELNGASLKPVVYEDASFSTPQRALRADKYLLTRQTFAEFPDLRVSGPTFADAKKITDVNPQQSDYKWGHRVVFDFTLKDGTRSQGILAIPDDYKQGEKRPMIVTFYEKNSQTLHRYPSPNYVTGMGGIPTEAVSKGYLTMLPDVYYRTGQSHSDQLEAVEAATKKVIEMGYVDPKRIAVHGHSYGGEGAAFIATRSRMFAAVGVGAGVTDLTTDFSQSWGWSYQVNAGSGDNAFEYYMESQGRWGFSPWDKPDVYKFESALTHAPEVTQPILIMHGTADPTVSFQEGMNFYQALRFNKKEAFMLAYPNEGHGLRGIANRKDLTIRYFQFFDHYLMGTPAPKWMTDGVPFLMKDSAKEPLRP
jgi:dipeptidyl aminopeptidase/acylaminoacyl peptidase